MNRILEGVDKCEADLILEATKEFASATEELKQNMKGFVDICRSFPEISSFVANLEYQYDLVANIDLDDVSTEYTFTDHYKMQTAAQRGGDNEVNPEYTISAAALEYPTYVNALKNTIMAIAEWAEKFPEIFSVGKNGIVFTSSFGGIIQNGNPEIRIRDMCGDNELGILSAMSGKEEKAEEDLKEIFKDIWLPADTEPEKEDESWDKFTQGIAKVGEAGKAAFDAATETIKNTSAPEEVQKSSKESGGLLKGLLGSILGESDDIEHIYSHADWIVGQSLTDDNGIFNMTFSDLQKLIVKVIEFSTSSEAAAAKALAAVDYQTKQGMQPEKGQEKLMNALKDVSSKLDRKLISGIGAALEQAGMKNDGDWSRADQEKTKEGLMTLFNKKEDQVNSIMAALFGEDESEQEIGDGDVATVLRNFEGDKILDDWAKETIEVFHDEKIIDDDGNLTDLPSEKVEQWFTAIADDLDPDQEQELKKALKLKIESKQLFLRWGKLAGIITG